MFPGKVLNQPAHLHDLCRIETDRRLIEDEEFRRTEQRHRKSDTLTVTFGKIADDALLDIRDVQALHGVLDLLLTVGACNALESRREVQIIPDAHVRIDRRNLRQIADSPLDLDRILGNVVAVHQHGTGGGGETSRNHVHCCRFSGAVRPQKAKNLMVADREGDIPDSRMRAIVFCQIPDLNHVFRKAPFIIAADCR